MFLPNKFYINKLALYSELIIFIRQNKSKVLQLKSQSVKTKDKSYIGLTQENLIEFQVQSIYIIYTS